MGNWEIGKDMRVSEKEINASKDGSSRKYQDTKPEVK